MILHSYQTTIRDRRCGPTHSAFSMMTGQQTDWVETINLADSRGFGSDQVGYTEFPNGAHETAQENARMAEESARDQ